MRHISPGVQMRELEVRRLGVVPYAEALAMQRALVEELKLQQSAVFEQDKAAQLGRQLGAQYFVTGKMASADEKTDGERRVQYFLYMQVIEVETGAIRWQNKAALTKGLIK